MTKHRTQKIDGLEIFYREAGDPEKPALVLLHGFPTSSHMYRHLIERLAGDFHLVAPDYPGFGNSSAPDPATFAYTFAKLTEVTERLLDSLGLERFGIFVQDYGSPVGFRLAARRPDRVGWIVCQNGNAYEEGFTGFWNHLREKYWQNPTRETEAPLADFLTRDAAIWLYTEGVRDRENISPDNWNMDVSFLDSAEKRRIQLDLFYDYRTNTDLYPEWQAYLRTHQPPTLVVWGKNDPIFAQEGALAFKRDLMDVELHFFDTGHFALEEDLDAIAPLIKRFYEAKVAERTVTGAASA
jgi:pimeloyl-ACP methyl ester carboxylesterase